MESKAVQYAAIVLVVMGFMSFVWVVADTVLSYQGRFLKMVSLRTQPDMTNRDCRPIPREQSTGSIRCWSGGTIVYENHIYHNGGILCSTDGKTIKITGGKSLCIIESDQANNWTIPALEGSPR